jgi:hypothetical protein
MQAACSLKPHADSFTARLVTLASVTHEYAFGFRALFTAC